MKIKTELYLTDREVILLKKALSHADNAISKMKDYLNILSTCSKNGEEYEMIEYDVLNLLEKIKNLSDEEIINIVKKKED